MVKKSKDETLYKTLKQLLKMGLISKNEKVKIKRRKKKKTKTREPKESKTELKTELKEKPYRHNIAQDSSHMIASRSIGVPVPNIIPTVQSEQQLLNYKASELSLANQKDKKADDDVFVKHVGEFMDATDVKTSKLSENIDNTREKIVTTFANLNNKVDAIKDKQFVQPVFVSQNQAKESDHTQHEDDPKSMFSKSVEKDQPDDVHDVNSEISSVKTDEKNEEEKEEEEEKEKAKEEMVRLVATYLSIGGRSKKIIVSNDIGKLTIMIDLLKEYNELKGSNEKVFNGSSERKILEEIKRLKELKSGK